MIRVMEYAQCAEEILNRSCQTADPKVEQAVAEIIRAVQTEGDSALLAYTKKFDQASLDSIAVSEEEIDEAVASMDDTYLQILKEAKERIWNFHANQKRSGFVLTGLAGEVLGQRVIPMERVGLYVPGGTAAYPSSVLMNCVPAQIAGVEEIVMVTPPGKDGKINPVILAAAKIGGVKKIFKVGGAQAVAALAYGTQTVPRVDKIVGPGNRFVAEAKRQVFGAVAIDMIAGPSEKIGRAHV